MRYWYILFLNLTLFSTGWKDQFQEKIRNFTSAQKAEQGLVIARYVEFCQAHAEFLKSQAPEPKKNDLLKVLEIKILVSRILRDLE